MRITPETTREEMRRREPGWASRKTPLVSEASLQQSITDAAEALGWRVWHDNDSRRNAADFPDLELIRDRIVKAELKRRDKVPTPGQERLLAGTRARRGRDLPVAAGRLGRDRGHPQAWPIAPHQRSREKTPMTIDIARKAARPWKRHIRTAWLLGRKGGTEWLTIGAQQTMHLDTCDVLIEGRTTQEACELRVSTDGGKQWNEWHTLRPQQTMHVDVR